MKKVKVPLRLDIAGSYTDLPGYREKGGMHIATPLDYYIRLYSHPLNTLTFQPVDGNFWVQEMNYRVAWWFHNNYVLSPVLTPLETFTVLNSESSTVQVSNGVNNAPVSTLQTFTVCYSELTPLETFTVCDSELNKVQVSNGVNTVQVCNVLNRSGYEHNGQTYPQTVISQCDLQHGAGLGGSSAAVVGLVKWYAQYSGRSMTPHQVAECACQVIEQTSICGRQDEFCSAFASPLYLYYNNQETQVQTFEWPEEFRRNIEGWNLLYIPRTISCQEMLEYEMNANLDMEPIVYFTKLMYKAIQKADWDEFWKWYVAHWKFVEEQNPRKINDEIRELRKKYNGIYIRPCGAGGGGYLLIHGNIEGENTIQVRITPLETGG